MKRPLLKLYAFNFFQSQTHLFFGCCFFVCFLFLFSCSLSRFSFRSCQQTNWVKGLEQSSKDKLHADEIGLLHEFLDHSSGGSRGRAQGGAAPPIIFDQTEARKSEKIFEASPRPYSPVIWRSEKRFWDQPPFPPPLPPLSEGPDSPLYSVTLTKWTSYSYIYKFHQRLH